MEHASDLAQVVGGVATLLLIAAALLACCQRLKLPFTVMLVLAGMGLARLSTSGMPAFQHLARLQLSPGLIFFVFLPTLIFESSFNLDARQLWHNLGTVMLLAGPGLLLSTFIIGGIVVLATEVPPAAALLLGAILSATDPVAVISLFKQLGAPQRLAILVEGESLFNDATAVVVAGILIEIVRAGSFALSDITGGLFDFAYLFGGGLAVGFALGILAGLLLGRVRADPCIEITLTTVLAYASFLFAESVLHVSGIMATVGAGLVMGGWGRTKISAPVRAYLDSFWEYMAFLANALIFLLVGMRLGLSSIWEAASLLLVVILAMQVSRAGVVYGLMPLVGRLQRHEPVGDLSRTPI